MSYARERLCRWGRHAQTLSALAAFLAAHPEEASAFVRLCLRGRKGLAARIVNYHRQYCDSRHDELPPMAVDAGAPGYVIFTPDYTTASAGVRCMYRLCDALNRRGYSSFITGSGCTDPTIRAPLIGRTQAELLCAGGFTAVYPEVIYGNPLHAKHVARWVLNRPGLLGGEERFSENELVFCYSDVYSPYVKNRIAGKLYMPTIDEEIFFPDNCDPRSKKLICYYVGKSTWKEGYVDRDKAFEITRTTPSKAELGNIFRDARVLYCFDNSTILIYEAIMCGCPVVIIPDGTQTKEDYMHLELGMDGIAWGVEELDATCADVLKLHARYAQVKRDFLTQLQNFIDLTQTRTSSRKIAA